MRLEVTCPKPRARPCCSGPPVMECGGAIHTSRLHLAPVFRMQRDRALVQVMPRRCLRRAARSDRPRDEGECSRLSTPCARSFSAQRPFSPLPEAQARQSVVAVLIEYCSGSRTARGKTVTGPRGGGGFEYPLSGRVSERASSRAAHGFLHQATPLGKTLRARSIVTRGRQAGVQTWR